MYSHTFKSRCRFLVNSAGDAGRGLAVPRDCIWSNGHIIFFNSGHWCCILAIQKWRHTKSGLFLKAFAFLPKTYWALLDTPWSIIYCWHTQWQFHSSHNFSLPSWGLILFKNVIQSLFSFSRAPENYIKISFLEGQLGYYGNKLPVGHGFIQLLQRWIVTRCLMLSTLTTRGRYIIQNRERTS